MSDSHHDDRVELDELDERLGAVERALADEADGSVPVANAGEGTAALAELRDRIDDLESRVTDLDAATQALRGYVGNVRSVNRDVEQRADAALAKVEALEDAIDHETDARSDETMDQRPRESPGGAEDTDRSRSVGPDTTGTARRCDHCGAAHEEPPTDRARGRGRTPTDGGQSGNGEREQPGTDASGGRSAGGNGRHHGRRSAVTDERTDRGPGSVDERDGDGEDGGLLSGLRESL